MWKSLIHSNHQPNIKSLSLLITWEIRWFMLCTNVEAKSAVKHFSSPLYCANQTLTDGTFFLNFILRSCQTFSTVYKINWHRRPSNFFDSITCFPSSVLVCTCVWHRSLLEVVRLSKLFPSCATIRNITALKFYLREMVRAKPSLRKQVHTFALLQCLTLRFFLTSSTQILLLYFDEWWPLLKKSSVPNSSLCFSFNRCTSISAGQLYLSAASFKRRSLVDCNSCLSLNLYVMFRAVTNICCSAREAICSSC